MTKKKTPLELGRRERQIVETVVKLGEASVADVRKHLVDPPSYSAVRAMLGLLVEKKWLKFRREGKRYLYRPAAGREKSQRHAVGRLLETFFAGSPADALAALLDTSASELTDDEYRRMLDMIEQARKENQ
ncbi:MAG: BlaI/MecI/CopY family transcriptional regulator [Pirellulaceae bacterium]